MGSQGDSSLGDMRWVPHRPFFLDVPAFGVLIQADVGGGTEILNGQTTIRTTTPNGPQNDRAYFVNGPTAVIQNQRGRCTQDFPCYALYDSTTGTPRLGERWGPGPGSMKLSRGLPGFVIAGPTINSNRVLVHRADLNSVYYAKVTSNWWTAGGANYLSTLASVTANPCYDMSGFSPLTSISLTISLPVANPFGCAPSYIYGPLLRTSAPATWSATCSAAATSWGWAWNRGPDLRDAVPGRLLRHRPDARRTAQHHPPRLGADGRDF